jgi:hypothetical protein
MAAPQTSAHHPVLDEDGLAPRPLCDSSLARGRQQNFNYLHDALDPALWETFSTTLGLEVPVLSSLPRNNNSPRAKCGFKKHLTATTPARAQLTQVHPRIKTRSKTRRTIEWSPCSAISSARLDTRSAPLC